MVKDTFSILYVGIKQKTAMYRGKVFIFCPNWDAEAK